MQFINHYGFTQRLHSDQGRNCTLAKGDKTITKPCHPMGNGQTERTLDGTLLGMLSTLSANEKSNWKHIVAPVVHAYNCTKNSSNAVSILPHLLSSAETSYRFSPGSKRGCPLVRVMRLLYQSWVIVFIVHGTCRVLIRIILQGLRGLKRNYDRKNRVACRVVYLCTYVFM